MNYKQNEKINQVKESTLVNYIDKTSIKSKKSTKSTKFDLFCKISTDSEHVYSEGFYKECVKGTMKS